MQIHQYTLSLIHISFISQINIIIHHRLQAVVFQGVENFVHRPSVGNLKLIITFILNIIHMASDSGADSGRDFCCRNLYQIVSYTRTFSCGYRNACKWHKQTISADYLKELWLMDEMCIRDRNNIRDMLKGGTL